MEYMYGGDGGDGGDRPTDIKQISTILNGWQLKSSIKEFWAISRGGGGGGALPRARKGPQTQNYRYPP